MDRPIEIDEISKAVRGKLRTFGRYDAAKSHKATKIAIFRYAYYAPLFKFFVEQVLDCEYLSLPASTRRTVELGEKYSSDYVCAPFKHMIGAYIEALERGADILVQTGGPCRLGYYGEVQENLLRDAGYEFKMLNLSHGIEHGYVGWAKEVLRVANPDIYIPRGINNLLACATMMRSLDNLRDFYMANAGFELTRGAYRSAWQSALDRLSICTSKSEIESTYASCLQQMRDIPIDKPDHPIRIAIVGELYTAIDADSNLDLDEKLISMGVEVSRQLNFSNRYLDYHEANRRRALGDYVKYDAGPTTTLTLSAAKEYAERGYDGIIHAKCAGCTPEIDSIPILRRITQDYNVPLLLLTYDTETSDTGLMTRLEAFYDMLAMRRGKRSI